MRTLKFQLPDREAGRNIEGGIMSRTPLSTRRGFLKVGAAATSVFVAGRYYTGPVLAQLPPLEQKDSYVVGFSQVGSNNPWRIGETNSMKQVFEEELGWTLIMTDANEDTAKQLADIDSILAQQPDIMIFPPRESQALAPKVVEIWEAGIPVILIDRDVDHEIARPGEHYITFIGSDFVQQGMQAAQWLAEATGGNAKIIQLQGTTGSDPAIDRQKGFEDFIAGTFRGTPTAEGAISGMEIIASQDGDFQRDIGRQVMEALLQSNPDVTAVYAHNDEMAIGAITALEAAGRVPGEDVILVSIDGSNAALDAIVDGTLGASVESSPFFGPIAHETMMRYVNGEEIEPWVVVEDRFFDSSNAAEFQGQQF